MRLTRTFHKVVVGLCLVALMIPGLARALELGSLSFASVPARSLSSLTFSQAPVAFTQFARAVGGVAFTSKAEGYNGIVVKRLYYDPTAADGSRLKLTLLERSGAEHEVTAAIYDWQLIPLARFVKYGGDAAVTLFGQLDDPVESARLRGSGQGIVNYHPEFSNTLLGLRLLQADMLAFEPRATELFRDNGKYILGEGEKAPSQADLNANRASFVSVTKWRQSQTERYNSYIVGDVGARIMFAFVDGRLRLTGEPTWSCWKNDYENAEKQVLRSLSADAFVALRLQVLKHELMAQVRTLANSSSRASNPDSEQAVTDMLDRAEEIVLRRFANDVLAHLSRGNTDSRLITRVATERALKTTGTSFLWGLVDMAMSNRQSLVKNDPIHAKDIDDELKAINRKVKETAQSLPVVRMEWYSHGFSQQIRAERGINPTVYSALRTSVQFAALFRHFAERDAKEFSLFVNSLDGVRIAIKEPRDYTLVTPVIFSDTRQ